MINHPQLVSLWAMIQTYAGDAAACCSWLAEQECALEKEPGQTLQEPWRIGMRAFLPRIQRLLGLTELGVYQDQVAVVRGRLDWPLETTDGVRKLFFALRSAIISSLSDRWFFFVRSTQARFYQEPLDGWDSVIATRFPGAKAEVEEAGRCLALDRGTGAVFHLMRAVEDSLIAIAKDLEVTLANNRPLEVTDQDRILKAIQKKIDELSGGDQQPVSLLRKQQLGFYSETRLDLQAFKDAWRNHVSHSRVSYDVHAATSVYQHVRSFINRTIQGPPIASSSPPEPPTSEPE